MQRLLPLLFFLLISLTATAGKAPKSGMSIFERWDSDQLTNVELHLDFAALEANRTSEDFLPARVYGRGQVLDAEVAVRGRFRRRTCTMPPLKLKFSKDDLRAAGLNTHNDFKLVTHCTDDAAGQEWLLREQLAYELYCTVNPKASFRTQLLTVTYVNTADGSTTTSYAILIEDTDELRGRLEAKNCKDCYNQPAGRFTNAEELVLFQYMIGNNDYSTKMLRNCKTMVGTDGRITAVPYDFDFSNLVDTDYANRAGHAGRSLRWEFTDAPDYAAAAARFLALEDRLLAQVDAFDELSDRSQREIGKYLGEFFRELRRGPVGS